jgi:hypothetical protein
MQRGVAMKGVPSERNKKKPKTKKKKPVLEKKKRTRQEAG